MKKSNPDTEIPTVQAVLFRSIKTKRTDGYTVKTVYVLLQTGVIHIERRFLAKTLNSGCVEIRKICGYVFQYEKMTFKLESFMHIANEIVGHAHKLNPNELIGLNDVLYDFDQQNPLKIIPPPRNQNDGKNT